jgi:hypothetical protein
MLGPADVVAGSLQVPRMLCRYTAAAAAAAAVPAVAADQDAVDTQSLIHSQVNCNGKLQVPRAASAGACTLPS